MELEKVDYPFDLNPSSATDAEVDDENRVKLVEYSIYNSIALKAVVHAVPGQWRVDAGLPVYPVDVHVHEMDIKTYPMRRLLRLINRKLPYERVGENLGTSSKPQPLKGQLYIHREDNKNLHFLSEVPSSMVLDGSTVMADIIDVVKTPPQGAVVYLRWFEDCLNQRKVSIAEEKHKVSGLEGNSGVGKSAVDVPVRRSSGQWGQETNECGSKSTKRRKSGCNKNTVSGHMYSSLKSPGNSNENISEASDDTQNSDLKLLYVTISKSSVYVPSKE